MKRVLVRKKMMWVVLMLLPSLAFTSAKAQDVLKLNLSKALEIALSENPTVKVADKEIEKKKRQKLKIVAYNFLTFLLDKEFM